MKNNAPILLAAGGTGGHIFPAEALAEELLRLNESPQWVTDKRFADFPHGIFAQLPTHVIASATMGGGAAARITGLCKLAVGLAQAHRLLARLQPKVVVGFGGYPSFPTMLAATQRGIATIIHEQNSVLGKANRMLAPRVDHIATSFAITHRLRPEDRAKMKITGNPVRAAIRALHHIPYPDLPQDGIMHLLVTGGSLGAQVFSEIVPAALATLPHSVRSRLRVDQQCREADMAATRAAYDQLGMQVDLAPFFTDMPARLARCHLVIARAGASTVSELAAAGRPAILVPLPYAADNHQYFNANSVADAGAGWVIAQEGFTAASLAARLEALLGLPASLAKAAKAAHAMGRLTAAHDLAQLALGTQMEEAAWAA